MHSWAHVIHWLNTCRMCSVELQLLNKIIIILMKNWNNMSMISIHFFIRTLSIFLLVGYPCHYCKLMKSYYLMILKQVMRRRRLRQWTHTRSMTTLYPPLVSLTAMHDHTTHHPWSHYTSPWSHLTYHPWSHFTYHPWSHYTSHGFPCFLHFLYLFYASYLSFLLDFFLFLIISSFRSNLLLVLFSPFLYILNLNDC